MKKVWDDGEIIAIKYLQNKWYEILDVNFKFSIIGEVDIIAKKDEKIIFIEVKYRTSNKFWTPEESVTKSKKEKIYKTMCYYCNFKWYDLDFTQFDIISIRKMENKLYHFKNLSLFE